jgi:hypothetical protein
MESSISNALGKVIHSFPFHNVWQHQLLAWCSITAYPYEIAHFEVSELKQCTQSWQLWYGCILKQTFWFRHSVNRKDNTATNLSLGSEKWRISFIPRFKIWSYWLWLQSIYSRISKIMNLDFRDFDISWSLILIQWLFLTNWDENL